MGTGGFVAVLIGSLAVLVPLQRRIIECPDPEAVGEMRQRWFSGHIGRSFLSVLSFVATALAAASG